MTIAVLGRGIMMFDLSWLKRLSVFWPEAKEALRKIVLSWIDGTQMWGVPARSPMP